LKVEKEQSSIWANMILIPFDLTLTSKAKAAIKKFCKFKNEEFLFDLRSRNFVSIHSKKFETVTCVLILLKAL
jgi:hypothetical protein